MTNTDNLIQLSRAIEQFHQMIFFTNQDGTIHYVNSAFEKQTGYQCHEIIGQNINLIHHPRYTNSQKLHKKLHHCFYHQKSFSEMVISLRKDGSEFYMEEVVYPLKDDSGQITSLVFLCKDISDQLAQESKIQKAIREKHSAEEASHAKTAFLANMSHELRTPLNAIIGYSEMLIEEAEELDLITFENDLNQIRWAGKHLLALINDILDLTKIEAGKIELFPETFAIKNLVDEVAYTIKPLVEKNHNHLNIELAPDLKIKKMRADVTRTRQCLFNLLSNAAKFTKKGEITLRVQSYQRNQKTWIQFTVKDTGIGITEAQQQKLFTEFSQADASMTRRFGGTGLGLVISQKFCQMMKGYIEVASQPNEGSTFSIHLPQNASQN